MTAVPTNGWMTRLQTPKPAQARLIATSAPATTAKELSLGELGEAHIALVERRARDDDQPLTAVG